MSNCHPSHCEHFRDCILVLIVVSGEAAFIGLINVSAVFLVVLEADLEAQEQDVDKPLPLAAGHALELLADAARSAGERPALGAGAMISRQRLLVRLQVRVQIVPAREPVHVPATCRLRTCVRPVVRVHMSSVFFFGDFSHLPGTGCGGDAWGIQTCMRVLPLGL